MCLCWEGVLVLSLLELLSFWISFFIKILGKKTLHSCAIHSLLLSCYLLLVCQNEEITRATATVSRTHGS